MYTNGENNFNHVNICPLLFEDWGVTISTPFIQEQFLHINMLSKETEKGKLNVLFFKKATLRPIPKRPEKAKTHPGISTCNGQGET